jgi:hypothetical protein
MAGISHKGRDVLFVKLKDISSSFWFDRAQSAVAVMLPRSKLFAVTGCSGLEGEFVTSDFRARSSVSSLSFVSLVIRDSARSLAAAAVAVRGLRRDIMRKLKYSLRELYRTLEEPGANPLRDVHTRLDAAVRLAYGMADDVDPLAFLLELNLACAAKEKAGKKITPPGLPLPAKEHAEFITKDCLQSSIGL